MVSLRQSRSLVIAQLISYTQKTGGYAWSKTWCIHIFPTHVRCPQFHAWRRDDPDHAYFGLTIDRNVLCKTHGDRFWRIAVDLGPWGFQISRHQP